MKSREYWIKALYYESYHNYLLNLESKYVPSYFSEYEQALKVALKYLSEEEVHIVDKQVWIDLGIITEPKNIDQMVLDFIFDHQEDIETAFKEEYDYGDVINRVSEWIDPCMVDLDTEEEFDKFKEILGDKVEAMMEGVHE